MVSNVICVLKKLVKQRKAGTVGVLSSWKPLFV